VISIIENFSHGRCELRYEGEWAEVVVLFGQGKEMDTNKLGEIDRHIGGGFVLGRHFGRTRKEVARKAWAEWFERWERRQSRIKRVAAGRRRIEIEAKGMRNG
jgi:hypothetical protein